MILSRAAPAVRAPQAAAQRCFPAAAPRRVPALPQRRMAAVVRATSDEGPSIDTDAILKDLQAKWDAVENKPQVALYGAGAIFATYLTSSLISTINHIPLLPKLFEFVGLAYSAWFTYRYLIFKGSREELITDVEELKEKITGTGKVSVSGSSKATTKP